MKKILSVLFIFCLMFESVSAQILIKKHSKSSMHSMRSAGYAVATNDERNGNTESSLSAVSNAPISPWGTSIGSTFYDMQSYGGIGNRIIKYLDGKLSAVWHSGQATGGRSVGYNHFNGAAWMQSDTGQNELGSGNPPVVNKRAGWPTIVNVENREVINFYTFPSATEENAGEPFLANYSRTLADTAWSQDTTEVGGYFFKSASSGNNIYVIGASNAAQNGVVDAFTFNRSSDGGQTWDISNLLMPDMDSSNYINFRVDEYAIDARDSIVVIATRAVTPAPNLGIKNILYRSNNYGEAGSWTAKEMSVVTTGMLDPAEYYEAPNWTIPSTDGVFSVVIDSSGMAHVSAGSGFTPVNDTGGASSSAYTNAGRSFALLYWNETMTDFDTITTLADPNINQNLDSLAAYLFNAPNEAFGLYWGGLCSYSSIAVDESNNIYVVFSALIERTRRLTEDGKATRDIYVMRRNSESSAWSLPMNVGRDLAGEGDPGTPELGASVSVEDMFPAAISRVSPDGMLDIIWIADNTPGNSTWPTEQAHEREIASVMHYPIPTASVIASAKDNLLSAAKVMMYPNPVEDITTLKVSFEKPTNVSVIVRDILGKEHIRTGSKFVNANEEELIQLDLSALRPGVYMYTIQAGEQSLSRKLVKR
jgi:hypothetical protein